ncbi:unnamed protein product [Brassicogethes aeneus]|uniref:Gem-associated protein 2 n=1 Tax=Brassicogethes aeneus TaxID=1431903 RepID=A0A9P0FHC0_BRAAE|nr:unnamed protein product [Brassicogethes aeneus]
MYESDSSEDEKCNGLMKKALDVELPDNFDPNSVPQTGEEYLHHVIYERSKCKAWVTAKVDSDKFKHKQTFKINVDENVVPKINKDLLPTKEWQTKKIRDFTEFRTFIESQIESEGDITCFNEETFTERVLNEKPTFSELIQYAQYSKVRMIQIISRIFDNLNNELNSNLGSWIYGILTLLEEPLSPSTCHTLREFAKKCALVRSKLPTDASKELFVPFNVYICIISRYFNQLDLADDF